MDMFVLGAVAVLAAMAGFWAGRSVQWQLAEAEGAMSDTGDREENAPEQGGVKRMEAGTGYEAEGMLRERMPGGIRNRAGGMMAGILEKRKPVKILSPRQEIGSPAAGQVSVFEEDGRQKIRVLPDQGRVYAPASGRITRLYPMGRAMLIKTELGADLLLQIGTHVDEMCSGYYRCRVMEHEIVRKGSLLLEYDPAAVTAEGANPEIILSVENEEDLKEVALIGHGRLKAGAPVLFISFQEETGENSRQIYESVRW